MIVINKDLNRDLYRQQVYKRATQLSTCLLFGAVRITVSDYSLRGMTTRKSSCSNRAFVRSGITGWIKARYFSYVIVPVTALIIRHLEFTLRSMSKLRTPGRTASMIKQPLWSSRQVHTSGSIVRGIAIIISPLIVYIAKTMPYSLVAKIHFFKTYSPCRCPVHRNVSPIDKIVASHSFSLWSDWNRIK